MSEHTKSPHERTADLRALSYGNCLSLVRQIAAEDLGVQSEGESLLEILQDVYAQGGRDSMTGLQVLAQTMGPEMTAAALGVDWSANDHLRVHLVDLGTDRRDHQYGDTT
jgi:hypothetical protein